jgi:hypothetical protein
MNMFVFVIMDMIMIMIMDLIMIMNLILYNNDYNGNSNDMFQSKT